MNRNFYKTAFNWVTPVVVVFVIITSELFLEGVFLLIAYLIYRAYDERDRTNSFFGKRKYLKGKLTKAISLYGKAYKTKKAEPKVCISYCYSLILVKKFQKAEEVLISTKKLYGADKIEAQILICENLLVWQVENRLIKAVMNLEKADDDLKTTSYHGIVGKLLIETGDLSKARKFNEQAYQYNEDNVHILENLIRIYCLQEDYERAVKVIPQLLKQKPFTKNAYHYAGLAYEKNNEQINAQKMYKKVDRYEETIFTSL